MRKNYFQNVKIADKLKMVMKAIFAILLVNNILFAILMLVQSLQKETLMRDPMILKPIREISVKF